MKALEEKSMFRGSYADLEQSGDRFLRLLDRDINDLASFGIDGTFRQNLINNLDNFKNYPTDEEFLGIATSKTEQKNQLRQAIHQQINLILVRAKHAFGQNSGEYKRFGMVDIGSMTDSDFCRAAKRVTRVAQQLFSELAAKGLTQHEITLLEQNTTNFDTVLDEKEQAYEERDKATQERAILSNKLYALIIEISDYGKTYYVALDESKYNDYVIYETTGTAANTPPSNPV